MITILSPTKPVHREMFRHDALIFVVQVLAPPEVIPGFPPPPPQPVDITNWKMYFTAKNNYGDVDAAAVSQLINGSGITYLTPTIGVAQINMPALATNGFPDTPVKLLYSIKVIDNLSNPQTVEFGHITVFPSVTRAMV